MSQRLQQNKIMYRDTWLGTKRLKISRSSLRKSRASKIEPRPRSAGFLGDSGGLQFYKQAAVTRLDSRAQKIPTRSWHLQVYPAYDRTEYSRRNVTCNEHVGGDRDRERKRDIYMRGGRERERGEERKVVSTTDPKHTLCRHAPASFANCILL